VRVPSARQSTDPGNQGVQMLFLMALWPWLVELHNRLFYLQIVEIFIMKL
jgi:hypothetical protein